MMQNMAERSNKKRKKKKNNEGEDFSHLHPDSGGFSYYSSSVSKKELQDLCVKHGLSPYKTKSELASALNSHLHQQLQSTKSKSIGAGNKGVLKRRSGKSTSNDSSALTYLREKRNSEGQHPQCVDGNELGNYEEVNVYEKAPEADENNRYSLHSIRKSSRLRNKRRETSCFLDTSHSGRSEFKRKDNKVAAVKQLGVDSTPQVQLRHSLTDSFFVTSKNSSNGVPSFEFSVRSEQGIKLIVDLNSDPLDWVKKLESEVHICSSLQSSKFQSFCQDLQGLGNKKKEMKDTIPSRTDPDSTMITKHTQPNSSPSSLTKEIDHLGIGNLDVDNGPPGSPMTESVAEELSRHLQEKGEVPLLATPNSVCQTSYGSNMKPCALDDETETMGSNVFHASSVELDSVATEKLVPFGPENISEDQIVKPAVENCGKRNLQESEIMEDHSLLYPTCSATGAMAKQLSDIAATLPKDQSASCSSVNDCSSGLVDVDNVNLSNSSPLPAKEWESGSPVVRSTALGKVLEKRSEDTLSDGQRKRKKHYLDSDKSNYNHEGRILRSSVPAFPRRSRRLVPKV